MQELECSSDTVGYNTKEIQFSLPIRIEEMCKLANEYNLLDTNRQPILTQNAIAVATMMEQLIESPRVAPNSLFIGSISKTLDGILYFGDRENNCAILKSLNQLPAQMQGGGSFSYPGKPFDGR